MNLSKHQAQQIINSLSSGVPWKEGVEYFTVGLEPYLKVITKEYLEDFIKYGGSVFKIVLGHYGEGKTHFLYNIERIAKSLDYVTSYVVLSPQETPFHKLESVYKEIVQNLSVKGINETGINEIIGKWIRNKLDQIDFDEDKKENLLEEVKEMRIDNSTFRKVLYHYVKSLLDNNESDQEVFGAILMGEKVEKDRIKGYGINEFVSKDNAFSMIRSLIQFIKKANYSGLVILFDEAEAIPSFSQKEKDKLLNNLRHFIDETATSKIPSSMFFYTVPDLSFLEAREFTYEALKQRILGSNRDFSQYNPRGTVINLENLEKNQTFFKELANKLLDIYKIAYKEFSEEDLKTIWEEVDKIIQEQENTTIYEGKKRGFVKKLIEIYDRVNYKT